MKNNILFITAAAYLFSGCGNSAPAPEPSATSAEENRVHLTAEQLKNAGITVGHPERRQMASTLKVNGVIDVPPQNLVSVSFPIGGYLQSTNLLPGMPVRKGQSIAVLEDPQYIQFQQDYLIGKVQLQYLESEFRRQQELNAGQAGSAKILQQAQTDYNAQKILVKALSEKLRLIGLNPETLDENNLSRSVRVYAPIDGFVSAIKVNIGKYVNPTDVMFELVNPRDIHLKLTVFEKDVSSLRAGQRVLAHTNDRPDESHPGKILLISHNVNEQRAVDVHCHFDRYDARLLPGMFMNAVINVVDEEALAVPESAVVRWENRHFIFVEKGPGDFELTEVEPGAVSDGYIKVLPAGGGDLSKANVVLQNAYTLMMKMKNTAEEE